MSGPFFDRLNPFKGSTSLDPKGFRVSARGTTGCHGTLLPCVQRKATIKSHIRGQFTSFPHCSVTLDGTLNLFALGNWRGHFTPFVDLKNTPLYVGKDFGGTLLKFTLVEQ